MPARRRPVPTERNSMSPRKTSAALLALMLLLGACSSGDSTSDGDDEGGQESASSEPTPTEEAGPTSEEFIAQADDVCTSTSQQGEEIIADFGVPKTEKEDFALGKKLISVRRDRLEQLRALEASEELQAQWDTYLEARQHSFDLLLERYNTLKDGDKKKAATLLTQVNKSDDEWQSIGEDMGFTTCAYKLSPEDVKQVEAVVTQFFEGEPAKTCSGFVSKAYLEYLGGKEGCVQNLTQASNVSISDVEGINGVTATAAVTGTSYGKRVSAEVTYEGGKYKVRSFYFS